MSNESLTGNGQSGLLIPESTLHVHCTTSAGNNHPNSKSNSSSSLNAQRRLEISPTSVLAANEIDASRHGATLTTVGNNNLVATLISVEEKSSSSQHGIYLFIFCMLTNKAIYVHMSVNVLNYLICT